MSAQKKHRLSFQLERLKEKFSTHSRSCYFSLALRIKESNLFFSSIERDL